jgi:hypothetical protein
MLVALALASATGAGSAVAGTTGPFTFTTTGLGGGGFVNVVSADPSGNGVVLAGGDTSGIWRSANGGSSWLPVDGGLTDLSQFKVASIEFDPASPGTVFAGVGNAGSGGGLLESNDDGVTWTLRSEVPQFAGGNTPGISGLPPSHPRSTGHLIAIASDGTIYAATFAQGVLRSVDGGTTWTILGLAGQHLRSIAVDPADPDMVVTAGFEGGIFRTTDASGTGTFTAVPASPARVEELRFVGGALYAAGAGGLAVSVNDGATWRPLAQPPIAGALWTSIDGHVACGATDLVATAMSGGSATVIASADGGADWTSLASPGAVHSTIGGPGGAAWWLAGQSAYMLGGAQYTPAMVTDASPAGSCGLQTALVAGRSGIWRTTDGGAAWYPAVAGLGITILPGVAADPAVAGDVSVGSSDWGYLFSLDGGAHFTQNRAGKQAFDVAPDPATGPGAALLATGKESANKLGEVWSIPNPSTGTWTAEGLGTAAGGKRPLAVASNLVAGKRVLIAAVDAGGIWRKAGSWSQVSTAAMATKQSYAAASLAWPHGSATAFLYDHRTGIWRSADSGRTWVKIWAKKAPGKLVGYVAVDPAAPGTLWVSATDGVYRIDGATLGTVGSGGLNAVRVLTAFHPGPIAIEPGGGVLVAVPASPGVAPALMETLDGGVTWQDVSSPLYRSTGGFAIDLSVGPDGRVYVATFGDGLLTGSR